jgi:D-alanyl-D-alanine carboxypeptidase/D-alanyl-D-alanine-endopeptidase (penicillin-binding protein 4)
VKNTVNCKRSSKRFRARSACVLAAALLAGCGHAAPLKAPVHVRPLPSAPPWGAASKLELRRAIAQALAPAKAASFDWSCAVLAQDGTVLYDDRAEDAVTPASTLKLVVASAMLARFDPQYRFHTVVASAQPPRDGTIEGDAWLIGSGDPSLRSDDLRRGAEKLRSAGIHTISGGVAVDASALSGPELNPYWNPGDANEDFMAPTSGASLDEDTVEFRIAGTAPGRPALVRIKPQSSAVSYYGSIATGYADDVIVAATGTPNVFRVSGSIPPSVRETFYLPLHGIPRYTAVVLTAMLQQAGIAVAGAPHLAAAPENPRLLWDHPSPALAQLIHHMMIFSDNHFAEQFLRVLGGARGGNDARGIAAERRMLHAESIPAPGLHVVDGSGLADADRIAAITLARVLTVNGALYPLLARGGIDGTVKRYHFTQARGRVRAKSGHLAAVSALAGYVQTRHHGRVVFAFLFNGARDAADDPIVAAVDRIAQR